MEAVTSYQPYWARAGLAGQKVEALFNVDLIYRVQLPSEIAATLTVNNLFDRDPSFYRATIPYNTAYAARSAAHSGSA